MPPTPTTSVARAPRRDAVRNDALVLAAAREVFSEQGTGASMESIASRAGLGVGTIYRRFAGKDALLDAISRLLVDELDDAAATALQNPDPAAALEEFLRFVGEFNAEKHRYAAALVDRVPSGDVAARTAEKVRELTARAVSAGALASTVTAEDIKTLIVALRGIITDPASESSGQWQRFLSIHLNGLRVDPAL